MFRHYKFIIRLTIHVACLPHFEKNSSLWVSLAVCASVNTCYQLSKPEPLFVQLSMYITPPDPISRRKSLPSVYVCMCALLSLLGNGLIRSFLRLWINATMEESLDASFSIRAALYERRVCGSMYPFTVTSQRLCKLVLAAVKYCSRLRFLWNPCSIMVK